MNSPLMTSVVGTSTDAPPPNAPLAPARATTMARPAAEAMIVRLLPRHMSLDRNSRFQTGQDNHFVIAHRTEGDRARPCAVAVEHSHRIRVVLPSTFALRASVDKHRVAGYDDDVVLPFELDVDSRGQIGHQLRVAALDADR